MTTLIDHWQRWIEACALGRCPPGTRAALEAFVGMRFRRYVETYAHRTAIRSPADLMPPAPDAWHSFETWLCLRRTREGKAYKQWLIAHAGADGQADPSRIESAATLLVRDAVREYLRREAPPACMVSLDRPAHPGDASDEPTLHDLLPDPHSTGVIVESHDLDRLARAEMIPALAEMSWRQRIALLARELGLPLSHRAVTETAGCGRTCLTTAYADTLNRIAGHIRKRFPLEDRSTQAELAIRLLAALRGCVLAWGRAEPACIQLARLAENADRMPLSGAA